jgi:hypothetical protein
MANIVICTHNVLGASEWVGHMSVYLQYIESLRRLGCEVYSQEDLNSEEDATKDANATGGGSAKLLVMRCSMPTTGFSNARHYATATALERITHWWATSATVQQSPSDRMNAASPSRGTMTGPGRAS